MSMNVKYLQAPQAMPQADIGREVNVRKRRMTLDDHATPFGCCDYFDDCADGIFSLYYRGMLDLLDWMGFDVSEDCLRTVEFINYLRPEQSQGADTDGHISDPCSTPNGIEFGTCNLSVEDFGLYGRKGPTRNLWKPKRYCKTRPRYFLDGSPVDNEATWDQIFTMDQILNDIRVDLISGNAATAGQFNGLEQLVATDYDCGMLDSYVTDWNNNGMAGGAGITINGTAIAATWSFIDVLLDIHRHIRQRIGWSPWLRNQQMQLGNTIIVATSDMIRCILDSFTCWSVCDGAQYEQVNMNTHEAREFRNALNGGLFGDGQIILDGQTIPLLAYDWGLMGSDGVSDIYYLTGAVGNQRIWEGEHLSADVVMQELAALGSDMHGFASMDGGRVLGKTETDMLCREAMLWMAPRLWCMAPWAQARFQDVLCNTPVGPLSPDPASSYYPEDSFTAAECD